MKTAAEKVIQPLSSALSRHVSPMRKINECSLQFTEQKYADDKDEVYWREVEKS